MRLHLIHHPAPRHAAALPGLLPDHGPAPLPRERASWRSVLHLLLFLVGIDAGDRPEDAHVPPARSAVLLPAAALPTVRPAHAWHRPHVPSVHLPAVHLPAIPGLAGRILHRGPRPASARGLSPVALAALSAAPAVPTAPTAAGLAGPTGNALDTPLRAVTPIGRYLPGENPATPTEQFHALTESVLAQLDLHYAAVREHCVALDALALTPLPSELPPPPPSVPVLPPGVEFSSGSHRRIGDFGLRGAERAALAALPPGARHAAGSAAAEIVIGGAR